MNVGAAYLEDALRQLRKLKRLADSALAQVGPGDLFRRLDAESNSLALIQKHLAGNMRSRWTDFLTTDGEKPDRDRDSEFEEQASDSPESIRDRWEEGWRLTLEAIGGLSPKDLARPIAVRGERHSVLEAIDRQLVHYAEHVGQIVFLAKHLAGSHWKSLSIPRGKSREFEVAKDGSSYRPPGGSLSSRSSGTGIRPPATATGRGRARRPPRSAPPRNRRRTPRASRTGPSGKTRRKRKG
jgi:Protein of unknown function (DUF1572)